MIAEDRKLKKILLIGGGGHCKSVLDSLSDLKVYDDIGIVDNSNSGTILNAHIVGDDSLLSSLINEGWTDAFVTVGSVGNASKRKDLYSMLKQLGYTIPAIIDKTAAVAQDVLIGEGTFVGKNAVINTGSKIDECCIINSGSVIEHECLIKEFAHVSPNATLCGQVKIGKETHIGAGSVIRQGLEIGDNVLIGIGSVVVSDIPSNSTAYGNPCKVVEK